MSEATESMGERWRLFRRGFMPSKALGLYVASVFITRFLMLLAVLVVVLQMMDLLNRSEEIMAADGATDGQLLAYISLRAPQLISQFTPFAVMLGTLFTLATLNQSSEITIMRAAGLSASQIIIPMLLVTCVVALAHFQFHERITVDSSKQLAYWAENDYRLDLGPPPDERGQIILNDGNRVIKADSAERLAGGAVLSDVTLYERDDSGDLLMTMDADLAILDGGRWTLQSVRRFTLDNSDVRYIETLPIALQVPVERLFAELERPDHARLAVLEKAIGTLREAKAETFTLETSYFHRFAQALSNLIMPLLASFVAFGVPRGGATVGRVVLGMAVGFSYFVLDTYMSAMGSLGVLPPVVASFSAFVLYLLAGLSLVIRLE